MFAKKSFRLFVLLSLLAGFLPSISMASTTDFSVKISTAGDESYTTALSNVSYFNNDLTFQFLEISDGGPTEYSISLPAGFVYQSSHTTGNACANFSILTAQDSNYRFSFNGSAGCLAKTEFTYRVTSSANTWNTNISILRKNGVNWSIINSVALSVVSNNSITRAMTADLNSNGYIDAYILSFATLAGVDATALSTLSVAGVSVAAATASGSNWILPFTDNTLSTGDTPQVDGTFDGVTILDNFINEEDGTRPRIMTITGTATTTNPIAIGTASVVMEVSEPLMSNSTGSFSLSLGGSTVAGNFSLSANLRTLTFTPTVPLVEGTYTLSNTTGATDWPAGTNTLSQTFPSLVVPDTTPPSAWSISINAGAVSTTSQTVSLTLGASDVIGVTQMMISNSPTFIGASWEAYATTKASWSLSSNTVGAYTVYAKFRDAALNESADYSDSISIVAAPTGGGGWGGGATTPTDYCPAGDLSGNLYDNICIVPATATGSITITDTATGSTVPATWTDVWTPSFSASPSSLSVTTLDSRYFANMIDARNYLTTQITDSRILKLADSYKAKIIIPDETYFLTVDPAFLNEYNRIVNAYTLLFLRVQDAVSGNKSDAVKNDGRITYGVVTSGMSFAQNFLDRYVDRVYLAERSITIYRTKKPLLVKALSTLENKILAKFDALLSSKTISQEEYNISVQTYNDFVLHLMVYRDYGKNPLSKERAVKAIKTFSATYAKKILVSPVQTIGDIYTFSRDIALGETSQAVRNLQAILKSYGYFGTLNPTGFFGSLTASYLASFSKEVLGIDNPNGLFDAKIRDAIIGLAIK